MKLWSLDARSRRRRPQALCVGSEGGTLSRRALRRASVEGLRLFPQSMSDPNLIDFKIKKP